MRYIPESSIGTLIAEDIAAFCRLVAHARHPALHPKRILTAKYHGGNVPT